MTKPNLKPLPDPPPQPPKPNMADIYRRAIWRKLDAITDPVSRQEGYQLVYLFVKTLPLVYMHKVNRGFSGQPMPSEKEIDEIWALIQETKGLISRLTCRELTRIFPIKKTYYGAKYKSLDYFSTMEELHKIGMDHVIGVNASALLMEYQNLYIHRFAFLMMGAMGVLCDYKGIKDPFDEWLEDNGVTPQQHITDGDGKEFVFDPVTSTTSPVRKARPRYLRPLD